ncbi:MAG: AsmA family protein, partial [Vibrio sp.]
MKKFLLILAIPVVAALLGVAALTLWINPNQFKPLIIEQAKQKAGLDLVILGDIQWQFLPKLGFEIGQTAVKNPTGFEQENL